MVVKSETGYEQEMVGIYRRVIGWVVVLWVVMHGFEFVMEIEQGNGGLEMGMYYGMQGMWTIWILWQIYRKRDVVVAWSFVLWIVSNWRWMGYIVRFWF